MATPCIAVLIERSKITIAVINGDIALASHRIFV